MEDTKYLSESILRIVLKKLEELKRHSQQPINVAILQTVVEQAAQQS